MLSARKFQKKAEDGTAAGEEVDDEIHLNTEGGGGGGDGEGSEDDD